MSDVIYASPRWVNNRLWCRSSGGAGRIVDLTSYPPNRGAIVRLKPKRSLTAFCAAGVLLVAASCGSSTRSDTDAGDDLSGQKLVFVNFGGDGLKAAQSAWLDPFMKETGAQVATDSPSDPAKVKAMVEAGNTTWDVIDLDVGSGSVGCGTLYEKRADLDIDASAVDPKYMSDDCGVPIIVQAVGLVYNTDKFGDNPPTKITDFLDTEKFPGQRRMLNYAAAGLESVLLADGVQGDDLYPLDFPRAAKAIKGLGNDLTLDASLAQESEALESGDFAMCLCYLGRTALSAEKGAPVDVVWDHAFAAWDGAYAIKGSKAPKAQAALLNYIATPDAQAKFTEYVPYGPTTPASKPQVSDEFKKWLPQFNEAAIGPQGQVLYDAQWWKDNTDEAFSEWTAMTSG